MTIKDWWYNSTHWLCERWDIMWNVKRDKPKGKLRDAHWVDHKEWDSSNN